MIKKTKIDFNKYWSPAFDTMSEFVYFLDTDFNVMKVNKTITDFTQKNEGSLIGKKCYEAMYDSNKPLTKDCPYKRMLISKKFETLELFIPNRDKWFNIRTNPIFDEKNNLIGGITFSEDITEHKKIEEEREKLLKAVENAREAVSITGEDLKIIYTNNALNKLFGYKKGELIGKEVTILNQEEGKDKLASEIISALNKRGNWEGEIPDKRKDGTKFVSFVTISAIKDKNGKILNAIATQHNITEQKKTELALKKSEEKFRTLAEESPNMIFINKRGKIVYVNKKCEHEMGYKKKEFYSPDFDFRKLVAPEFSSLIEKSFNKHMKGKSVYPYEYSFVTKFGMKIEAILTTKLIDFDGDMAILGILTDISDRKKLEQTKDNLICDVSHGLKHPIAITEMALEICKKAIQDDNETQINKFHSMAYKNIKKAHKDVNNILEIFALETGSVGFKNNKKEKISLPSVFNEILKGLNYVIAEKELNLSIDLAENAKNVEISRKDAIILMSNILDNAIKFTKKGSISIKSRLKGKEIEITVKDTGSGIESKDIKKVFDKFYRCHSAIDGSGLGLAICRGIVDIYKGKIEARSKGKDQGTTMIIKFPKS